MSLAIDVAGGGWSGHPAGRPGRGAGTANDGLMCAPGLGMRQAGLDPAAVAERALGGSAGVAVSGFDQVVEGCPEHAGGELDTLGDVLRAGLPALGRGRGDDPESFDGGLVGGEVGEPFVDELVGERSRVLERLGEDVGASADEEVCRVGAVGEGGAAGVVAVGGEDPVVALGGDAPRGATPT